MNPPDQIHRTAPPTRSWSPASGGSFIAMLLGIALGIILGAVPAMADEPNNVESTLAESNWATALQPSLERAENAGAIFMLGLVLGMSLGIVLFFVHLRHREKRLARQHHDDWSFDNWPLATDPFSSPSPPSYPSYDLAPEEEMIEQREPWERSVDWWKEPDEPTA